MGYTCIGKLVSTFSSNKPIGNFETIEPINITFSPVFGIIELQLELVYSLVNNEI